MKSLTLTVLLIAFIGCKAATPEQLAKRAERKAKRIANRAYADSVYLAQRKNYMIELQGENFPESQDQDNDHQNE
jgi:hypothetical protein